MIGNMGYFILGACLVINYYKYVKLKLSIKNIIGKFDLYMIEILVYK